MFFLRVEAIVRARLLLCLVLFLYLINVGHSLSKRKSLEEDFGFDNLELAERNTVPASHTLESSSQLDVRHSARVVERHKWADSRFSCPSKPASGSETGRSYLLLYSPDKRQDVTIAYGGFKRGGWSGTEMKKLVKNGFNASQPSLIYLHAFTQSARSSWLEEVRKLYDDEFPIQNTSNPTSFNLLFFDWSAYSRQAYGSSVSWMPHLGRVLGDFLNELADSYSYDLSKMHLISYSLSTHIAGNAGRRARKLGQITALDPTGVCLHHDNSFAKQYALKASDAKLVVARHYDMYRFGAKRAIGGVDVFVNGGKNQPGSRSKREAADYEIRSIRVRQSRSVDSHGRAAEHETQAEDGRCYEVAYACRSYSAFRAGECGSCGTQGEKCYYLNNIGNIRFEQTGVQVRLKDGYKSRTKMHIKTGPNKYCLHHYQLLVKLRPDSPTSIINSLKSGLVTLNMGGSDLQVEVKHRADSDKFTALVLQTKRLRKPTEIIAKMRGSSKVDEIEFGSLVEYIEMNYMSHAVSEERKRLSARYCWNSSRGAFIECKPESS